MARAYRMLLMVFAVSAVLGSALCTSAAPGPAAHSQVAATGIVEKQGITTYMYGTHVLVNEHGKTLYALRSKAVNLDKFVGKKVLVEGDLIHGYPVDFGPDYLDVKSIHPAP